MRLVYYCEILFNLYELGINNGNSEIVVLKPLSRGNLRF